MNNDIATLARDVLDDVDGGGSPSMSLNEPDDALATLARAVNRVADLADRLDEEGRRIGNGGGGPTVRAFAHEIRAALNGGDRG